MNKKLFLTITLLGCSGLSYGMNDDEMKDRELAERENARARMNEMDRAIDRYKNSPLLEQEKNARQANRAASRIEEEKRLAPIIAASRRAQDEQTLANRRAQVERDQQAAEQEPTRAAERAARAARAAGSPAAAEAAPANDGWFSWLFGKK
ncbi:MAG: hypothetical protein NT124_05130 [Candidatus Dependentiae bacterium]|nr:hypothetical protein [Candidatus Dependentiae bacterium]